MNIPDRKLDGNSEVGEKCLKIWRGASSTHGQVLQESRYALTGSADEYRTMGIVFISVFDMVRFDCKLTK